MELPDQSDIEPCDLNEYYNDLHTPRSIAIKLYTDENETPFTANILGLGPPGENDELFHRFELLLSIFLEMMIHMMVYDPDDPKKEIDLYDMSNQPNFADFDMELYYPIIRNKFKKISHLLSIETYERNDDIDYLLEVVKDRYNRVILLNNPEDTHYFLSINSCEQYDFIPSQGSEPCKKLKNIYSIMNIGPKLYKISFDTLQIYTNNFTNI